MLKKMTAIFMVAAVTNAYAFTPVKQSFDQAAELKKTYDELNYKLNVEWNQQDSNFRDDALKSFEHQLASLQKQGLTSETLVKYTMDQMKDESARADILTIATSIHDNKMNSEEARVFALSKVNSLYAQGASWSGSRMRIHAVLVVAAIILIVCALSTDHGDSSTMTIPCENGGETPPPTHGGSNGGNNGYGNGDQDAPGGSCENNNAENAGCTV